jgi:hypothetical protein
MLRKIAASLTALSCCLATTAVVAADVDIFTSSDPQLIMRPVDLPGGKTSAYTLGIGSGAFRHKTDPANTVWTIGDRGPNMVCSEARAILGADTEALCNKLKNGRVYPTPDYSPSIYRVELDRAAKTFKLLDIIALKTKTGRPILGLLNPQTVATKDTGMDLSGKVLPDDPDNVDLEGIVRLADGTFWIAEEMGPSVAQVAADGRILKRYVPADAGPDYAKAEAEIVTGLPAILSKRQGNRGIEGLAISPDERFIYFIVQNPLANPDAKAYQNAKNTRLFKMERDSGKLVGEYVYQLDDPQTFGFDPSPRQNEPRISEMTALGLDRLLVLERTDKTTKLHEVVLDGASNILGSTWDDVATSPSLEQNNDIAKIGVVALRKTLRLDTFRDSMKDAPEKIEGLAILGDGALLMINDNDFGMRGDATQIVVVKGAVTADPAVYGK